MGSPVSMMRPYLDNNILLKAAIVDIGIQWLGFGASWLLKTEKIFDLTGSSSFLYLTWVTLIWAKRGKSSPWSARQIIQNSCVSIWALRLGVFLFTRVIAAGDDRRFARAKQSPSLLFTYWTVQAVWVWITLWPTMIVNTTITNDELLCRDYIGYVLFAVGLLVEVIADHQKKSFRAIPDNKDKFISSGLWSLSRHPNYFGEILLWAGLYLPASTVMSGNQWYSVLSPFFIAYLITKVSGVPLLERYADKKWGDLPQYKLYKAQTTMLIPFIW